MMTTVWTKGICLGQVSGQCRQFLNSLCKFFGCIDGRRPPMVACRFPPGKVTRHAPGGPLPPSEKNGGGRGLPGAIPRRGTIPGGKAGGP